MAKFISRLTIAVSGEMNFHKCIKGKLADKIFGYFLKYDVLATQVVKKQGLLSFNAISLRGGVIRKGVKQNLCGDCLTRIEISSQE